MRKEQFVNGNFYHIYNRGVDKRTLFLEQRDYARFFMALYLLNDANVHDYDLSQINLRGLASYGKKRNCLVDIIHWALLPNHFHLLLRQRSDNGITAFMQKVGTSFSMYFNKKHERTGRLFEGTFKAKYVARDDYLSHLSAYISLNPLGLRWSDWKEQGIPRENFEKARQYLLSYHWSSYCDYFGENAVPDFVSKSVFNDMVGDQEEYEKLVDRYLSRGLTPDYIQDLLTYEAKPRR